MLRAFLLLLALSLSTSLGSAQTLRVPGDHPTIQSAVYSAPEGARILVAPGVYNEQVDFLGKSITLVSEAGPEVTTIDSSGLFGWLDVPFYSVVRFVNGESRGAILQGFTITGFNEFTSAAGAPVTCWNGATPTILDCIVRDNQGGWAGGVYGDAHMERCTIQNNLANGDGGGVAGVPTLIDCVIRDNSTLSGHGGGVAVFGECDIIDCRILNNSTDFDGRGGGGVWGPANLLRCLVAGNRASHFAGQSNTSGAGIDGALSVRQCTVAFNDLMGRTPGTEGGGITNTLLVESSIVWGNTSSEIGPVAPPAVSWSNVQGGYPGTGNIDVEPEFRDVLNEDYTLERSSGCVDAGDPSVLDPDGTRADQGAFFVPQHQALAIPDFGQGVNPSCFQADPPAIGQDWSGTVDTTAYPGAVTTVILTYLAPSPPIPSRFGEILIDLASAQVDVRSAMPVGGMAVHTGAVPLDFDLIGEQVHVQAFVVGPGQLCNAYALRFGL